MSRTVLHRVAYRCDACKRKASEEEALRNFSMPHEPNAGAIKWRQIRFGGLKDSGIGADAYHACSFSCAIRIMKRIARNLRANDAELMR